MSTSPPTSLSSSKPACVDGRSAHTSARTRHRRAPRRHRVRLWGHAAKWSKDGCAVYLAICTDGSKGTWDVLQDPAELVRIRKEERARHGTRPRCDGRGRLFWLAGRRTRTSPTRAPCDHEAHPTGRPRCRLGTRSVEALPTAPRPPQRRIPRHRRSRRRSRPSLLSRARARAPSTFDAPLVRSRRP